MTTPDPQGNKQGKKPRSWPYAITAILVLALQQGWAPRDVATLASVLLVLIALVRSAGNGGE
ncbi:hypothetical protein J7F03_07720 [Streptomyces sp. ISL-43]|uniref:hypothetical protein n=1 Tax=Streptomyces sp. ISL-43 TaxID=2819183 RepID=UPI001BE6E94C|nr:hypothetical protein [Streptomyces sp. ISL-43]MBT2446961.1 hypothetical protein [Streptomyces sp. ISL-43]